MSGKVLTPSEKFNEDALAKIIASGMISGGSLKSLAAELGCSRNKIRRIYETESCKRYMKELGDEALHTAKHKIRVGTALLVDKIVATIHKHLEDKNLNAIPHALKILGFSDEEKDTVTNLQVVFEDPNKAKTVTAEFKREEE